MKITKLATITAALSASLLMNSPLLKAQAPAPAAAPATTGSAAPAAGGNGGGGGQNWRQNMADRIKTELKATDDEWAVIQPLLTKVTDLQRAGRGGFGGGPGGRRGGGQGGQGGQGGNGGAPAAGGAPAQGGQPQGLPEAAALTTALASDSTSNDDIKAKLAALRDAKKKVAADLAAARADLQKVLTLRQEAVLVNMGILE